MNTRILKVCHLGPMGSGKSQFLNACKSPAYFNSNAKSSIYSEYQNTELLFDELPQEIRNVKLVQWDISGNPKLEGITTFYLPNTPAYVLHYDISNRESLRQSLKYLDTITHTKNKIKPLIFLIGNKADLQDKRQITFNEAKRTAEDHGLIFLGECSAKNNTNITHSILRIAKETHLHILEEMRAHQPKPTQNQHKNRKKSPLGLQILFGVTLALIITGIAALAWPVIIALPFVTPAIATVTIAAIGSVLAFNFAVVMKEPVTRYLNPELTTSKQQPCTKHLSNSSSNILTCLGISRTPDLRSHGNLNEYSDSENQELDSFDSNYSSEDSYSSEDDYRPSNSLLY